MFGKSRSSSDCGAPTLRQTTLSGHALATTNDGGGKRAKRTPAKHGGGTTVFNFKTVRHATAAVKQVRRDQSLTSQDTVRPPPRLDRVFSLLRLTEGERTRYWRYLQALGLANARQPELNDAACRLLETDKYLSEAQSRTAHVMTNVAVKRSGHHDALSTTHHYFTIFIDSSSSSSKRRSKATKVGAKDVAIHVAVPEPKTRDYESAARFIIFKIYLIARLVCARAEEARTTPVLSVDPRPATMIIVVRPTGESRAFRYMRRIVETATDSVELRHLLYGYHCTFLWP